MLAIETRSSCSLIINKTGSASVLIPQYGVSYEIILCFWPEWSFLTWEIFILPSEQVIVMVWCNVSWLIWIHESLSIREFIQWSANFDTIRIKKFDALFLVERGILILPCAFHALFREERGILILPCAFKESIMLFTDRQGLGDTLHDPYDSYESTATGNLRWTLSFMIIMI